MKQIILLTTLFISTFIVNAQTAVFDTIKFNELLSKANQLLVSEEIIDYSKQEFLLQYRDLSIKPNIQAYTYIHNGGWIVQFGLVKENIMEPVSRYFIDSIATLTKLENNQPRFNDSSFMQAIVSSYQSFQKAIDTCDFYISTIAIRNSDETISVFKLPAMQPSGQALYGCEWEYVYNKTGSILITTKNLLSTIKGIWIGQPREIWLNYREFEFPTIESLFFALKYRDFFTKLRIDTRNSISTTSRYENKEYIWTHKLK